MSEKLMPRWTVRTRALLGLIAALSWLVGAQAAHAAFPGANGKIVFDRDGAPLTSKLGTRIHKERSFNRESNETDQLFTINPDGSAETDVSNNSNLDEDGNWSADGLKITFDSWTGANRQIFSMNGDGSSQTGLSNTDGEDPAWSPDGSKVAFARFNPTSGLREIWVMNADGSNQHPVFTPDPTAYADYPNWSPDGTKIVFSQFGDIKGGGPSQIFVANADGSGTPQNLSNNSDWDEDPNWSPDGTKIVFDKYVGDNGAPQIWMMNADGSAEHVIASANSSSDSDPAFSPDGTQVVYQNETSPTEAGSRGSLSRHQEIWVVGADGSNNHQVTTPPAGFEDYEPDWQPVGSPVSAATFPTGCTATGSVVVHAADPTHFISALGVHYKVDGGAEQGVAADASGNVAIPVPNGTHTVEYWASDAAGYLEAAHHTGTLTVDTVNKCAPKLAVAGVRRACVAKTFRIRVNVSTVGKPKSVRVFLGKKRLVTTTKTSFTLKINPKKLAHRTRLRIVATSATGQVTTTTRTITRCAVAKPRRHVAPRFTG